MRKIDTLESWMISNGKSGDIFYSHKKDRHLTAIATHHKRMIRTERLIVITGNKEKPICSTLTKITLI
jgi:hypothetical protein